MEGVPDTEKNRMRVEKKLESENLFAIVNKKGFATFFNGEDKIVLVKEVSSKENYVNENNVKKSSPKPTITRRVLPRSSELLNVPESLSEEES